MTLFHFSKPTHSSLIYWSIGIERITLAAYSIWNDIQFELNLIMSFVIITLIELNLNPIHMKTILSSIVVYFFFGTEYLNDVSFVSFLLFMLDVLFTHSFFLEDYIWKENISNFLKRPVEKRNFSRERYKMKHLSIKI